MAREPVERTLPPLRKLLPQFKPFPKGTHRLKPITAELAHIARRLRKSRNQPFYSMREAARFFRTHLSTMGEIYGRLERQGLVTRVRGAQTVLLGKTEHTHVSSRSIISIPLPLSSFVSSPFTRLFFQKLATELARHRFVSNFFPYVTSPDAGNPAFTQRLVRQSDIVIWLFAVRIFRDSILTLHDHGVRNVVLRAIEDSFIPADYLLDWTHVYRELVEDWKSDGIREVVVAKTPVSYTLRVSDDFVRLLNEQGISSTLAEPDVRDLRDKVAACRRRTRKVGCAILYHELTNSLCNDTPLVIAKMSTQCRMLFGRGAVYAPYFSHREFRADIVGFEGEKVATRVAHDLGRRSRFAEPVRIYPRWMPRAKLSEHFV